MSDLNNVTLSGRLTKDSEYKELSKTNLVEFSLAVNRKYKDNESTTYVDCIMFGDRASKLSDYLVKGKYLIVNGELRQETWEKDGQKRSKLSLVVNDVVFAPGSKQDKDNE